MIEKAAKYEDQNTRSFLALSTITKNMKQAEENISPLCQDTGMLTFKLYLPIHINQMELTNLIKEAITEATKNS